MLLRTLMTLQAAQPGFETKSVLAVNVPVTSFGRTPDQIRGFYRQLQEKLMTVAIQHAGAVRGLLLLPQGDDFEVEAEAMPGDDWAECEARFGAARM